MEAYWNKVADRIFGIDEHIRYVGIVDMGYHVVLSKMRSSIKSMTPSELDWNFVSMAPRIMIESAQRLEDYCGPLEIMTIRYRRVMLSLYRAGKYVVMVSFEPTVQTPFMKKLSQELSRILHVEQD
jgi:hypothetical protein